MSRSVRFNLATGDGAPEKNGKEGGDKTVVPQGGEEPASNVFGTSGLHFIALQKVTNKTRRQYIDIKRDLAKDKLDNDGDGSGDSVILEVRALHLRAKLKILEEIRGASEQQLVVEADKRLEHDRKQMEMQREMHRRGLDPEHREMAKLDRETWGEHEANEKRRERKKRERGEDRARRAQEESAQSTRKAKLRKKRSATRQLSKSRSTSAVAVKRVARRKSSKIPLQDEGRPVNETHFDDASDANYNYRVENQQTFEGLEGTDSARAAAAADGADSEEEEAEDVMIGNSLTVPGSVYDKLFSYQQRTVAWMWGLHEKRVGGILGDEMGLGKTIQVIAFLAALHHSGMHSSPTLILCPATVMIQWLQEIHKWHPPFRVWLLHPSSKNLNLDMSPEDMIEKAFQVGDIVITTYSTFRSKSHLFVDRYWGYIVCDEGHQLRNSEALITQAAKNIKTDHRLLLTGAPMQNNLRELWSLFDFVCPGRLGTMALFESQFIDPIRRGGYVNATKMMVQMAFRCATVLREVIEPYLLRRLKVDVAKQLPQKTERVLFCKLTQIQRTRYEEFIQSREVNQVLSGDRRSFRAITMLRKICNHVDLLNAHMNEMQKEDYNYGKEWDTSGKMVVMDQILSLWFEQGDKALVFSQTKQMLDIIETYVIEKGFKYLRMDGDTAVQNRQLLVDEFNKSADIFVFLLTTRVGGLGLNLTGANRVILYDPDWNPSVDVQARERVWRIGQENSVTIYRLITTGTIEEKMYHRQIFKTFLANKVLKDPRQKRFFKSQDLYDLFSLAPEDTDGGTETGAIFGEGSELRNVEGIDHNDEESNDGDESNGDDGGDGESKSKKKSSEDDDRSVLKALWDGDTLQSAFRHDVVDNNVSWTDGSADAARNRAASEFARSSREALRRSRHEAMLERAVSQSVAPGNDGASSSQPSITGGLQGRFGRRASTSLRLGQSLNNTVNDKAVDAGSRIILSVSSQSQMSSASLLSRIHTARDSAPVVEIEPPNFIEGSGGSQSGNRSDFAGVPLGRNRRRQNSETPEQRLSALRADLQAFIQNNRHIATTEMILEMFGDSVKLAERKQFKQMLRSLATCEDGFWSLRES